MLIRRANPRDAAAIEEIWTPVILHSLAAFNHIPKTTADIEKMIVTRDRLGHGTWVAVVNQEVVGFATYDQFRGGAGYARTMEHTVMIKDDAGGRGIGRALMDQLHDHARASGVHSIFAGVSGANPAGVAFHAALGYELVVVLKEVGHKFGKAYDLHLMQKFL